MFRLTVADNLEIRQFEPEDAATVFAVVERNRDHLRQWLPWVGETPSFENVRNFIDASLAQFHDGFGPNGGIWLGGSFIGAIGCHSVDLDDRNCLVGYWIEAA